VLGCTGSASVRARASVPRAALSLAGLDHEPPGQHRSCASAGCRTWALRDQGSKRVRNRTAPRRDPRWCHVRHDVHRCFSYEASEPQLFLKGSAVAMARALLRCKHALRAPAVVVVRNSERIE
jgi:hypothetical protein